MHEDVSLAQDREEIGVLLVLAAEAGLGDWVERRVANLAEARDPVHVPQVRHVEQAAGLVQLPLVDLQRRLQLISETGAHRWLDLEAHNLPEPATAKLLLHR